MEWVEVIMNVAVVARGNMWQWLLGVTCGSGC